MRRYIEPDRLTAASASSARKNHRCQERFARAFRANSHIRAAIQPQARLSPGITWMQ